MQHYTATLLHEWLCRNVLTMNVEKTCYITFDHAKSIPDMDITIDSETMQRVRRFKYLGLVLDEKLPPIYRYGLKTKIAKLQRIQIGFIKALFRLPHNPPMYH